LVGKLEGREILEMGQRKARARRPTVVKKKVRTGAPGGRIDHHPTQDPDGDEEILARKPRCYRL